MTIEFKWYLNRQGIRGQQGVQGEEGYSPTITVNEDSLTAYTLRVQNKNDSFVTPNLRQTVQDNGGTYVRYDRDSGQLYAGLADGASTTQAGIVRFATPEEVSSRTDLAVMTPADLADYLANDYELPVTSKTQYGIVKIGDGLAVSVDGTVSATPDSLPMATSSTLGVVKPDGSTTTIDGSGRLRATQYTLPAADSDTLGGVKIGSGVNVEADGTISVTPYTLPIASTSSLGGIKVGANLTIGEDGTLNATASQYTLPTASTTVLGGVKVDGTTITIDENGVIKSNGGGGAGLENVQDVTNGVIIGDLSTPIPSTGNYYRNTIQLTAEPNSSSWDDFNLTINSTLYTNGITSGEINRKILTENNGIVFVKLTEQEYTDLANKNSTTMYITTDTNKVFLGTIELTGGGGSTEYGNVEVNNIPITSKFEDYTEEQ